MGEPRKTPGPSLVYRGPNQASAGRAQIMGQASGFSKDFPANESWMEIFVIAIYQVIFSYFSEVRERLVEFCPSWSWGGKLSTLKILGSQC